MDCTWTFRNVMSWYFHWSSIPTCMLMKLATPVWTAIKTLGFVISSCKNFVEHTRLLHLHFAFVRSKLEYVSVVFSWLQQSLSVTRESSKKIFEISVFEILRLLSGKRFSPKWSFENLLHTNPRISKAKHSIMFSS